MFTKLGRKRPTLAKKKKKGGKKKLDMAIKLLECMIWFELTDPFPSKFVNGRVIPV